MADKKGGILVPREAVPDQVLCSAQLDVGQEECEGVRLQHEPLRWLLPGAEELWTLAEAGLLLERTPSMEEPSSGPDALTRAEQARKQAHSLVTCVYKLVWPDFRDCLCENQGFSSQQLVQRRERVLSKETVRMNAII